MGHQELVQDPERELVVVGFGLDRIGRIEDRAHGGVIPYSWLELAGWTDMDDPPPERFWRTLVANRGMTGGFPPAYFRMAYKWAFLQGAEGDSLSTNEPITHGSCSNIATEFLRRVQAVVWDWRLFQSDGEKSIAINPKSTPRCSLQLFGLAPGTVQRGDYICVLYGCSVPVILRKVGDSDCNSAMTAASGGHSDEHEHRKWDSLRVHSH